MEVDTARDSDGKDKFQMFMASNLVLDKPSCKVALAQFSFAKKFCCE